MSIDIDDGLQCFYFMLKEWNNENIFGYSSLLNEFQVIQIMYGSMADNIMVTHKTHKHLKPRP